MRGAGTHASNVAPGLIGHQPRGFVAQTKRGLANPFQAPLIAGATVALERVPIHGADIRSDSLDVVENVREADGWIVARRHVADPDPRWHDVPIRLEQVGVPVRHRLKTHA